VPSYPKSCFGILSTFKTTLDFERRVPIHMETETLKIAEPTKLPVEEPKTVLFEYDPNEGGCIALGVTSTPKPITVALFIPLKLLFWPMIVPCVVFVILLSCPNDNALTDVPISEYKPKLTVSSESIIVLLKPTLILLKSSTPAPAQFHY